MTASSPCRLTDGASGAISIPILVCADVSATPLRRTIEFPIASAVRPKLFRNQLTLGHHRRHPVNKASDDGRKIQLPLPL
jgi:hypothetical protein